MSVAGEQIGYAHSEVSVGDKRFDILSSARLAGRRLLEKLSPQALSPETAELLSKLDLRPPQTILVSKAPRLDFHPMAGQLPLDGLGEERRLEPAQVPARFLYP